MESLHHHQHVISAPIYIFTVVGSVLITIVRNVAPCCSWNDNFYWILTFHRPRALQLMMTRKTIFNFSLDKENHFTSPDRERKRRREENCWEFFFIIKLNNVSLVIMRGHRLIFISSKFSLIRKKSFVSSTEFSSARFHSWCLRSLLCQYSL